ncbi:hypothetical protein AVEN_22700-1 [Araneus ventricosus]|uniref:Uncharacterized protein n=1 Tax=Araneus ventricosus TaxID=182803 RepID=A0A4Y2SRE0_ARAVE|nr:hypothetical protein AVEN_80169-1 [Araneus ventricosus]GBN90866.1 hypothetical protein AVEN_22700-1 [Araneus ventricosus]
MPRQCVPRDTFKYTEEQYEKALTELTQVEKALKELGTCPDPKCSKHHVQTRNIELEKAGQYPNSPLPKSPFSPSKLSNSIAFQKVSPKKAARPQLETSHSPIETSNRFQNLMDTTENNTSNDAEIKI